MSYAGRDAVDVFNTYYIPRAPCTVHHESYIVHCNIVPKGVKQC